MRLQITDKGKQSLNQYSGSINLGTHILYMMKDKGKCNILDVVDFIRANFIEYHFTDVKVYMKYLTALIKNDLVEFIEE